ncbi:MAG: hypothetical protein Q9219_001946 [cf. Caloplaca sp. 3 TL-2023]
MAAARNAGIPKDQVFLLEGTVDGFTSMRKLLDIGQSYGQSNQVPSIQIPPRQQNKDLCGFLSFSDDIPPKPHRPVVTDTVDHNVGPRQVTALNHALHLPVLLNAEVYMLPAFTMKDMLHTAVKYKIKELLLVPPILIRLVRDPIVDQYDLSHLRRFSTGAAPISEEIIQLLQKKFPQTEFKQGYGMTESCACVTAHPPELYGYEHAHAVGTLIPCTEAKIIDLEGKELGVNQSGEVLARGPQVVMGYLNNAKATAETFDNDGWLHTGDEGFFDEQGLLTITDRIKEMIKVKGIGVAPAELEDLLLGHPRVEDAAVLGIHDDYSGERPKAFIVTKAGVAGDEALARELIQYVKDRKVRHKWVVEIEFVEEIPKSASGKILRRVLRDKSRGSSENNVIRDEIKEKARL